MKLSLLIPTTPDRADFLTRITREIRSQIEANQLWGQVEIVTKLDNYEYKIGWKRNFLLNQADGQYVAFIDDDDMISADYLKHVMEGVYNGADCCSLTGIYTEDGGKPEIFQHSIKYGAYKTNAPEMPIRYERYPNHLNCIKSSIAKQFKFPEDIKHGEDTAWATQIHNSGMLKTEHWIDPVIYYYEHRSKK